MSHQPLPRLMLAEAVPAGCEPLYEYRLAARHTCPRRSVQPADPRPVQYLTDLFDIILEGRLDASRPA